MNFNGFNFIRSVKDCRAYGLGLWQCPQFLFPVMGAIIIVSIISTYFIARYYVEEMEIIALIILAITTALFIIGNIIISSFEIVAASSRAKSEFVNIMSHQLRTPLSIIRWQLNLLNENKSAVESQNKEVQKFLSHLEEENQRMIHIINDLLELNRIEDNALVLNPVSFSIKEIIENIVERRNKTLTNTDANLSIETQFPQDLPNIFADKIRTEAVLSHIMDNAIRYSANGGKIIISLEVFPRYVCCSVKDQGVGISKEDQNHIFKKFFRAENVYKYQTQGLGVRLYLARAIIERSNGKIGFISQEGKGSTFWFALPVAKA